MKSRYFIRTHCYESKAMESFPSLEMIVKRLNRCEKYQIKIRVKDFVGDWSEFYPVFQPIHIKQRSSRCWWINLNQPMVNSFGENFIFKTDVVVWEELYESKGELK